MCESQKVHKISISGTWWRPSSHEATAARTNDSITSSIIPAGSSGTGLVGADQGCMDGELVKHLRAWICAQQFSTFALRNDTEQTVFKCHPTFYPRLSEHTPGWHQAILRIPHCCAGLCPVSYGSTHARALLYRAAAVPISPEFSNGQAENQRHACLTHAGRRRRPTSRPAHCAGRPP